MAAPRNSAHPYIPNSAPRVRQEMMRELDINSMEELFADIPDRLRLKRPLNLPGPLSELDLVRHVKRLLSQNRPCGDELLSFLGGGCWQHFVPAVCDEIAGRGEFLTAYTGDTYEDHGRWQALFEFASLLGELLNMEVVSTPTYDWGQAAATSMRMAGRATGRSEVLVPRHVSPERLAIFRTYLHPYMSVTLFDEEPSGQVCPASIEPLLAAETAAVYVENPSYLGVIQTSGGQIAHAAHNAGALFLVGADPSSLGVLAPPADYGADIVSGDLQPLGIHMNYGGGLAGFIATRDEPRLVMELPTRLVGIAGTGVEGEYGFGEVAFGRTSFIGREKGKEYVGTGTNLWGITAGVYLALMGPEGMRQLGEGIMQRTRYAMERLAAVPGLSILAQREPHFKEFVVCFNGTGASVAEVNAALLREGILGGRDLSADFPELGQSALYCATEVHRQADMDRLVEALRGAVGA
ncbi:MAG: aminomethyl-transferring glycine dehydrogenase subunit GcvPA [Bacillota bacterium]|nr:aminomethyl-transferring glycine dehydrogenase subunit GcvPA [Bacillota bacterium]